MKAKTALAYIAFFFAVLIDLYIAFQAFTGGAVMRAVIAFAFAILLLFIGALLESDKPEYSF